MSWHKNPHEGSKHGEVNADVDINRKNKIVTIVSLAIFSAIILIASACVVALCLPMPQLVDNPNTPSSGVVSSVGSTRLQTICPIRLSLPDLTQYGDSEYNESEGDLQSSARYGAFGDVYSSSLRNMRDSNDQSITLNSKSTDDDTSAFIANNNVNHDAQVLEGHLSRVGSGTGISASMVSWATKGDVKGLSATTCSMPSMKQTFLVPESADGISIRLEAFNAASKSTVVRVKAWSAEHGSNQLNLSTGSAFTVPARSHAYFDLAAASPKTSGLYVQVESEQTPIASFVKVVHMSGLSVKGVDIVHELSTQSNTNILSGISEGDQSKLYVWPSKDGNVTLSWMNDTGSKEVKDLTLKAHHLQVVDLGKVPEHVNALSVSGDVPTQVMMSIAKDGKDNQSDVAFITPSNVQGSGAIVSPVSANETALYLSSSSDKDSSVRLQGFDLNGVLTVTKNVTIPANASLRIPVSEISHDAVMFIAKSHSKVSLSARIHKDEIDKAGIAGISWLSAQSLEPQEMNVYVKTDNSIVQ